MRHRFLIACIAAVAPLASVAAYDPAGDIAELYDFSLLASLRPGVRCKMFSSYDRTGGNNDGFSGTYSKIRVEDGRSVLAEMQGPGCIHRIWFTHSEYKVDGLLERKGEHIRVYLDGKPEPAIDVPLADLFSGKLERFPAPLVASRNGGFSSYVPIPYRAGCKVTVDGTAVRFYHITYSEFASAENVKTFSMALDGAEKEKLAKAVKAWSAPGNLQAGEPLPIVQTATQPILLAGRIPKVFSLPPGPCMVRAVELEAGAKAWPAWKGARLQMRWDGAEAPGIDLPADYFFGQAMRPPLYRSLLVGGSGTEPVRLYNFFPMPYQKRATVTVLPSGSETLQGTLKISVVPLVRWQDDFAYAHAAYGEALPARPKVWYPLLARAGKGHYAGTYIVTEGPGGGDDKLPLWLEGDERFTVDGELRIHGTGTEDYFNFGWYAVPGRLDGPVALPLTGFPIYQDRRDVARASAYRWHLTDPVPFEKEIVAEIEHGGENDKSADYRSATFWYDAQPAIAK